MMTAPRQINRWTLLALLLLQGCAVNFRQADRDHRLLCETAPKPVSDANYAISMSLGTPATDLGVAQRPSVTATEPEERVDTPIDLHELLRMAMQSSNVVRVQDGNEVAASEDSFFDILAKQADVQNSLAAFDANLLAEISGRKIKRPPDSVFGPGLLQPEERDELQLNFGWTRKTTLGGTTSAQFSPSPSYLFIPDTAVGLNPRQFTELELGIRQPLLRGAGRSVTLVPIEVSQLAVEESTWNFKKTLMTSVRDIVNTYWDLKAAIVAEEAVKSILPLLEEVVRIQKESLRAQWVTKTEVAKAEAQLYGFRRDYEERKSIVFETELRLRSLAGICLDDGRRMIPVTKPIEHDFPIGSEEAFAAAINNQPDVVQRRLAVRLRTIERRLARNGTRPQLDLFAKYRQNGLAENVGEALAQLVEEDFSDWEVGLAFAVPLGRRQSQAELRSAELNLAKDRTLLEQELFTLNYQIRNVLRGINYSYRQYVEANQGRIAAEEWVQGAQLRYENPNVEVHGSDGLVQNLNEYLDAIRFRTVLATAEASLLAEYNSELIRLEEEKGTLLSFFGIVLSNDPCRYAGFLPSPTETPLAILQDTTPYGTAIETDLAPPPAELPAPDRGTSLPKFIHQTAGSLESQQRVALPRVPATKTSTPSARITGIRVESEEDDLL